MGVHLARCFRVQELHHGCNGLRLPIALVPYQSDPDNPRILYLNQPRPQPGTIRLIAIGSIRWAPQRPTSAYVSRCGVMRPRMRHKPTHAPWADHAARSASPHGSCLTHQGCVGCEFRIGRVPICAWLSKSCEISPGKRAYRLRHPWCRGTCADPR